MVTEVKAPHWIGRPGWYCATISALVPWLYPRQHSPLKSGNLPKPVIMKYINAPQVLTSVARSAAPRCRSIWFSS